MSKQESTKYYQEIKGTIKEKILVKGIKIIPKKWQYVPEWYKKLSEDKKG